MTVSITPKVSVIVATWRQADTIGRTLDSILAQVTDFPIEIIIGEDASPDATRQVCEEYMARYPQVIRLMPEAPNKGVTRNYFDCLEAARGEYIADCAGDDWWTDSSKLKRQVEFLDSHPEVSLVHTAWRPVDAKTGAPGNPVCFHLPSVEDGHSTVVRLLRHDRPLALHLCTALYRRDKAMKIYAVHRKFLRDQLMEDLTISCLLLEGSRVGYLPLETLAYSIGGDQSICEPKDALRRARFYRNSLDVTCRLANMTGIPRRSLSKSLKRQAHHAISLALLTRNKDEIRSTLAVCRRHKISMPLKSYIKRLLYSLGINGRAR